MKLTRNEEDSSIQCEIGNLNGELGMLIDTLAKKGGYYTKNLEAVGETAFPKVLWYSFERFCNRSPRIS